MQSKLYMQKTLIPIVITCGLLDVCLSAGTLPFACIHLFCCPCQTSVACIPCRGHTPAEHKQSSVSFCRHFLSAQAFPSWTDDSPFATDLHQFKPLYYVGGSIRNYLASSTFLSFLLLSKKRREKETHYSSDLGCWTLIKDEFERKGSLIEERRREFLSMLSQVLNDVWVLSPSL